MSSLRLTRPTRLAPTRPSPRPRLAPARAAETARGAIDAGLTLFEAGDAAGALGEFQRALTLPGTGLKRYRDKPPAPSPGELQAAHFNAACAHAALGDVDAGLTSVAACVAAGYDDGATLDADPDLAPLRGDARFAAVTAAVPRGKKGGGGGLFGGLFGR